MVVEGLRAADPRLTAGLATHLAADAGNFDPSHPPSLKQRHENAALLSALASIACLLGASLTLGAADASR